MKRSLLKGNYYLNKEIELDRPEPSSTEKFESEALKVLGGSIALVLKPKQPVWKPEG